MSIGGMWSPPARLFASRVVREKRVNQQINSGIPSDKLFPEHVLHVYS
jgi:hypothetical protein